MPRSIKHARISENALRRNATSIDDLIAPTLPGFDFTVDDATDGHALFQRWKPQTIEEEDKHLYNLLLDAYRIIYKETDLADEKGHKPTVFEACKLWMQDVPSEQMAAMTLYLLSVEQKKFILARNRGEPITREEIESLLPIYAGGNSGPLIYILVARPRNVEGENIYKSKLGPDAVRYYVGSANQKDKNIPSGSRRIYEHGDQFYRISNQARDKPKQFYQYAFGDPAIDSSNYEDPCILAFEILSIPESFAGMKAPTVFFEACICDLTHSYGTDTYKSIRISARAAAMVSQPASIVNTNTTPPYAWPGNLYPKRTDPRPIKQDPAITKQNVKAARKALAEREEAEGGRKLTKAHNYGSTGKHSRHNALNQMFKDGLVRHWTRFQENNDLHTTSSFLEWDIIDGEQVASQRQARLGLSWSWIEIGWSEGTKPVSGDKAIFTLRRFTTDEGDTELTVFLETAGEKVNLLTLGNKDVRERVQIYLSKVKLFHGDTEPWKDPVKLEEYHAFLEARATVGKLTGRKAESKAKEKQRSRKYAAERKAKKEKEKERLRKKYELLKARRKAASRT